jgi:hypothetical protein
MPKIEKPYEANSSKFLDVKPMPKKVHITIRLVPEAAKVPDENLKNEIEKELRKNIFVIPWADQLESLEIK